MALVFPAKEENGSGFPCKRGKWLWFPLQKRKMALGFPAEEENGSLQKREMALVFPAKEEMALVFSAKEENGFGSPCKEENGTSYNIGHYRRLSITRKCNSRAQPESTKEDASTLYSPDTGLLTVLVDTMSDDESPAIWDL
jgi:hypothetical protein